MPIPLPSYKDINAYRVWRFQKPDGSCQYGASHPGHPTPVPTVGDQLAGVSYDYLADCQTLEDAQAYAIDCADTDRLFAGMGPA